jgi:hypothetical protein
MTKGNISASRDTLEAMRPNARDFPYTAECWQWLKMIVLAKRKSLLRRNLHSLMTDAVALACRVERNYDPARGASFKTVLAHELKSLGRRNQWDQGPAEFKAKRDEDDNVMPLVDGDDNITVDRYLPLGGIPTNPAFIEGGPGHLAVNHRGVRVTGSIEALSGLWEDVEHGRRFKAKVVADIEDQIRGVIDHALANNHSADRALGHIKAVIALKMRARREVLQERRNQNRGDYGSAFYEPSAPKLDLDVAGLPSAADLRALEDLSDRVSPTMRAVLKWLLRPAGRTQRDLAKELRRTEQAVSAMVRRAERLLRPSL